MKLSITATVLAISVLISGCQPAEQPAGETKDTAPTSGPPQAPAAAADCPQPDDSGRVAIADGLQATILRKGYGNTALLGDEVTVNADLWVYDQAAADGRGNFVWDSGDDGFSFRVGAGGFIAGWSPGVACMLVGEQRELIIAPELAYGADGRAPIPGGASIIYLLELVAVQEPDSS